ncbi:COG1470 family protein [Candidatus Harpocratesius sp.]
MADKYNIKNVGKVVLDKKTLMCDFSVTSDQFFVMFGNLASSNLPRKVIQDAIKKSGKDVKIGKKDYNPLKSFFEQVQSSSERMESSTQMGFDASEGMERAEAEKMKSEGGKREIEYQKDSSTGKIFTHDKTTGNKEGEIILGPKGAVGELVPLEIIEKVETHFEFNGEADIEEDRKTSGLFKVINPSSTDKIWDIDVSFKKEKSASIDENVSIKSLEPGKEYEIEYEIEEFEEPALKLTEFISTQNDESIETYSLAPGNANRILFKITAKNTTDYDLKDIKIKKEIPEGYMNIDIVETSNGQAETDIDNFVVWTVDTIKAGSEVSLKLNMSIEVHSAEEKINTGKVFVEYFATKALTGIQIDKFDAYSNNFVGMEIFQQDSNPDKYDCRVIFENESDFQMQLVNLDIVNATNNEKVLDIDPGEIPPIASGARWESVEWETETENGEEPKFYKTVEFFLVSDHKITTMSSITIDDIELAVAMMDGKLRYSISSIASFQQNTFEVLHQVKNTGGADLNELIIEDRIQSGYIPPKPEEIELFIVRPPEDYNHEGLDEEEEIDWEDLGEQITVDPSFIEIEPATETSDSEHLIKISLTELRDSAFGMFLPGMIIKAKYTIIADKPPRDTEFVSNVRYLGNTYPAGAQIEIIPEAITIPVVHERKKIRKGKRISALASEGEYEIVLRLTNTGENVLTKIELRDVVPDNFEYGDYSEEPSEVKSLEKKDMLVWVIEEIAAGDTVEIRYKITGTGEDYKASEAQFSL